MTKRSTSMTGPIVFHPLYIFSDCCFKGPFHLKCTCLTLAAVNVQASTCEHDVCNVSYSSSFEFCNSDINQRIVTNWDFPIFPDSSQWKDARNDKTYSEVKRFKSGSLLPCAREQVKVILSVTSICLLWCKGWEICTLYCLLRKIYMRTVVETISSKYTTSTFCQRTGHLDFLASIISNLNNCLWRGLHFLPNTHDSALYQRESLQQVMLSIMPI